MLNINSPYTRFMAEAEGIESITSTRQTRINAAIKDFIIIKNEGYDINDKENQDFILEKHNIKDITQEESEYIARKVMEEI